MSTRTKLILTGGGTRGMYQIGVAEALRKAGFLNGLRSISASSIGALNACLLLQYTPLEAKEIWIEFTKKELFKNVKQNSRTYAFGIFKEMMKGGVDPSPLEKILHEYIDEDILRAQEIELVIALYNLSDQQLEYPNLDLIPSGQLIDHVMASARLPFFRGKIINQKKYLDGGFADNEPEVSHLENKEFDHTFIARIAYVKKYLPKQRVVNIISKKKIIIASHRLLGSPLSFESPSFEQKYFYGYEDACRLLEQRLGVIV